MFWPQFRSRPGRPFHVLAVRTGHVLGQRRVLALLVAAHVRGDPAALEEAFGRRVGETHQTCSPTSACGTL